MNQSVSLITTGGTIASISDESGVRRPALGAQDLQAYVTESAPLRVRELMCKDSSLLDFADLDLIVEAVLEETKDPAVSGVVVAHGTDTLEETAMLLHLMASGDKPVVITGAALPASDPHADGPDNLRDAFLCTAEGEGVSICFAGHRIAARGAYKRHTGGLDIFGGQQYEAAMNIAGNLLPHTIAGIRVDTVSMFLGADRVLIDACVAAGARGIVLATLGNGGVPDSVAEAVEEYGRAGVAFVACSRVAGAPVTSAYSGGDLLVRAGAVLARELHPPQARIQLAALLAQGFPIDTYAW